MPFFRLLVFFSSVLQVSLAVAQVNTFPYLEDFEEGSDFDGFDLNNNWGTSTFDGAGNHELMFNMYGFSSTDSPIFDCSAMTEDPILSVYLRFSFSRFRDYYGQVNTWYSLDGGQSWIELVSSGTESLPIGWSTGVWKGSVPYSKRQIRIPGGAGKDSVMIRFGGGLEWFDIGADPGDGFRLDNFRIRERSAADAHVHGVQVAYPKTWNAPHADVSFTVRNDGTQMADIPLVIEVATPTGILQTYADTLRNMAPGADTLYQQQVPMATVGGYQVTAYSQLAGDPYNFNDTVHTLVSRRGIYFDLLVKESFENAQFFDTAYYQSASLTGARGAYFAGTPGRGSLSTTLPGQTYQGSTTVVLDGGNAQNNQLILTLDGSDYQVATDNVHLRFAANTSRQGTKQVYVRGSSDDSWVKLYDFGSLPAFGSYVEVSGLSISDALRQVGQEFSGTMQVAFRQERPHDNASGRLWLDVIELYTPTTNAKALGLTYTGDDPFAPVLADSLVVSVLNAGLDTLHEVPVQVVIKGHGHADTLFHTYTGEVLPQEEVKIYVTGADFSQPNNYTITATLQVPEDEIVRDDQTTLGVTTRSVVSEYPYYESFESAVPRIYNANAEIVGALGCYHTQLTGKGTLQFSYTNLEVNDGEQATVLTAGHGGTNALVLTLDLSAYDPDIEKAYLSFLLRKFSGDTEYVWIRGNPNAPWLTLLNWSQLALGGKWNSVDHLDLGRTLTGGGQSFSDHTQIMFRHTMNLSFGSWGVAFDSLMVQVPDNDLVVNEIYTPLPFDLSGADSVTVEIWNTSTNSLRLDSLFLEIAGDSFANTHTVYLDSLIAPKSQARFSFIADLSSWAEQTLTARLVAQMDGFEANNSYSTTRFRQSRASDLPFLQDFEQAERKTYNRATYHMPGVAGMAFNPDDRVEGARGTLKFYDADRPPYAGEQAAYLGVYTNSREHLVLTADLSDYEAATDSVFLSYVVRVYRYVYGTATPNGLFMRGSVEEPWKNLRNWPKARDGILQYVVPLSEFLTQVGQDYSATTQWSFTQGNQLMALDNIVLSPWRYDAYVSAIELLDLGDPSSDVQVMVGNQGAQNVEEGLWVYLEVESPSQTVLDSVWLESTLMAMHTDTVVFDGALLPAARPYTLRAWTAFPQDQNFTNDTLVVEDSQVLGWESEAPSFVLYPVPTHDELTVEMSLTVSGQISMALLDLQGRVLYQHDEQVAGNGLKRTLSTAGLAPGLYNISQVCLCIT